MKLKIYMTDSTIDITPNSNIQLKDILEQLEQGNIVLIETIDNTMFIINCININAIEILKSPL